MLPSLTLAVLAAAQEPSGAPQPAPGSRPRVGLVLSGGGARGAAHVGVIEVLEEARIPVDFVVGTSMGAIVGGLYAAGASPAELRATIEKVDWITLFDDEPPREHLTWRRREEDRDFLVAIEAGWKDGGLSVPRGVVQGLKIEPLFRNLTIRAHDAPDFDALPLPFRAVAMDLATGERVVLRDGDLAEALRASMSIAGAFAPVERDGRELVDGGYVDNLPISVALELGADVVIAVDVGTPPESDVRKIGSFLTVASQVQDVVVQSGRERARALLRPQDVLVEPALGSITFASFDRSVAAADIGRQAALARTDALASLSVSEAEWARFVARQRAPARPPQALARVRLENRSSLADAVIEARIEGLGLRELDPEQVDRDLARLAGMGIFDRVDYRTEPDAEGRTELVYSVREKSWGPTYLRFGLGLYDDFQGAGRYALGIGWTTVPFSGTGAEWRTEFSIGTPLRIATELWIPLDSGLRWFVAPLGSYEKRNYDLDDDPEIRGEVLTETWEVGADVGRVLADWGELRVGVRRGDDSNTLHRTVGGSTDTDLEMGSFVGRFAWDTLDLPDFPREGLVGSVRALAAVDALGSDESFESVLLSANGFTSFGDTTIGFGLEAGTSFDDELPVSRSFFLGGFGRLSGSPPESQSGDRVLLARVVAWQALSNERSLLGFPLFLGATLEAGHTWAQSNSVDLDELQLGGSLFVACDTPLGPAALSLGATDGTGAGLALVFGRLY
ncbi:MAG: patatin-like phospholipase family protein [Planctomycetes bacterium]|nr:patatin-like phospholipase family protein [Planctomycetota bacterium]